MIQIKNLSIYHKKDLHPLVQNLSFVLNDGDKAAIIGEEGNGKSTLLKLIYDAALVEEYAEYSGEIVKNNQVCGYLAQELSDGDQKKTVYEYLSEEPGFADADYRELMDWTRRLGLPAEMPYSETSLRVLSGGEKVKIQLLRILAGHPDVLLLDEPSNDIDLDTLIWLEKFVSGCRVPVLYISHDETLLENTANVILHMEQIRRKTQSRCTVIKTDYRTYVEKRRESLEKQERLAIEERAEYEKQQTRFRRIHDSVEYRQRAVSRQNPGYAASLKKKIHSLKAMERRFEKQAENMTQMPEFEDAIFFKFSEAEKIPAGKWVIDYSLPLLKVGERVLSHDIELQVRGPEKICIVGKNGVGKTTLLRRIAQELLPRRDLRAAYMPQNYEEILDQGKTPVEFLSITFDKAENTEIRTYLGSMKYTADEMDHPISQLSGGQKAKLLLLKMSREHRNVLILDEPSRNFSPLSGPVIREMLASYQGAVISISHDRKYISEVCETVYELDGEGLHKITYAL